MPFMLGPEPVRRTAKFLTSGCGLEFLSQVRVFTMNYNTHGERHAGARQFVFWRMPQIQYHNPSVQLATFKNCTPTPFARAYFDDGREMLVDLDGKSEEQILEHVIAALGKSREALAAEALAREKKDNPANFGVGCERPCICEVRGQVPCPGVIPLPKAFRGKCIKEMLDRKKK